MKHNPYGVELFKGAILVNTPPEEEGGLWKAHLTIEYRTFNFRQVDKLRGLQLESITVINPSFFQSKCGAARHKKFIRLWNDILAPTNNLHHLEDFLCPIAFQIFLGRPFPLFL